jgi:polar amino acid transport system permease protein
VTTVPPSLGSGHPHTAGAPADGYRPSELRREREAHRRKQTIRSVLIAAASTAVVGVALSVLITGSPGWPRLHASFFNAAVARKSLAPVATGLWLNMRLLFFCSFGALAVGLLLALGRTARTPVLFPVRALATTYTYVFRGVPLIIVLYLFTFGVPGLRLSGTPSILVLGALAMIVTYGAYMAEVFRAGIESVHPSQRAAARSLGLTQGQTMRRVVLPQAVRRVAPPLLNDLVSLQKDVGLISLAGPIDAIRAAQIETQGSYNFTPYIVAGVLFVLLATPLIAVTDWLTMRAARRQSAAGTA